MENNEFTEAEKDYARKFLDNIPFAQLLGFELVELERGTATVRLKVEEKVQRHGGMLHGGATASLIDTAMAFAVATMLEENEAALTIDLTVHYLRSVKDGTATAEARIVRAGKRFFTVSADVFDEVGRLCATAISTYSRTV